MVFAVFFQSTVKNSYNVEVRFHQGLLVAGYVRLNCLQPHIVLVAGYVRLNCLHPHIVLCGEKKKVKIIICKTETK